MQIDELTPDEVALLQVWRDKRAQREAARPVHPGHAAAKTTGGNLDGY